MNGTNLEHSAQACVLARDTLSIPPACARPCAMAVLTNKVSNMTEQTKPKSSMAKFRRENRRVDYYGMPEPLAVIERLRKCNPGASTRELIDALIVKGGKAFFPDESGANSGAKK